MANTVQVLSYANTFGDWIVVTDSLVTEVNNLSKGNYTKDAGLLTLAGSGTGLQVSNNALIQGNLVIQGTGTALSVTHDAIISGNLVVLGNTTFSGYEIDMQDITSNTIHANTATINVALRGTNSLLNVTTDLVATGNILLYQSANILGNLTVQGNTNINLNEVVVGSITANAIYGQANTQINQQILDSANSTTAAALAFSIALG